MRTRGKRKNGELKTRVKKRYIDKDRQECQAGVKGDSQEEEDEEGFEMNKGTRKKREELGNVETEKEGVKG